MPEPLREYLHEHLPPAPVDLEDDEMITDVVLCYRVERIGSREERYGYTSTIGCSYGQALGMSVILQDDLNGSDSD